jgi:ribosomal protein S18 acetylase RimI-like enzyme
VDPRAPHWREARPDEDDRIVALCRALNEEDPGPRPVPEAHVRRTLARLRAEPVRGRALALEVDGRAEGYALLIAFWSNELGGEICTLDEIYVAPAHRGRGLGTRLIESLVRREGAHWPADAAAVDLEVTPANARARALYARLGFTPLRNSHLRLRF